MYLNSKIEVFGNSPPFLLYHNLAKTRRTFRLFCPCATPLHVVPHLIDLFDLFKIYFVCMLI